MDYRDAALRLLDASGGLLGQHDALAGELEGMSSQRDALVGKVQDLQDEIAQVKRQAADLEQSRAETIERLESERDALAVELEGAQAGRDALAGKVQDLEHEIAVTKRQAADLDQSRAATIKKLESERDALAGKVRDLERELDRARQLAAALERASQTLTNYDALLGAFEQKDWAKAVELGEWLAQFAPDLARPQAWLAHARNQLERQAARGQDRKTWERDGKEMLRVPAGEFLYGDKKEKVALPEFWIDQTPVTNAEYKRFLDANPQRPVPASVTRRGQE